MDYEQKYAGIGYNTETEFEFAETQGWQEFKHLESLYNDLKKL